MEYDIYENESFENDDEDELKDILDDLNYIKKVLIGLTASVIGVMFLYKKYTDKVDKKSIEQLKKLITELKKKSRETESFISSMKNMISRGVKSTADKLKIKKCYDFIKSAKKLIKHAAGITDKFKKGEKGESR